MALTIALAALPFGGMRAEAVNEYLDMWTDVNGTAKISGNTVYVTEGSSFSVSVSAIFAVFPCTITEFNASTSSNNYVNSINKGAGQMNGAFYKYVDIYMKSDGFGSGSDTISITGTTVRKADSEEFEISYTLHSESELTITVNCTDEAFDPYIFGFFKALRVDGAELTRGTDYTAEPGSVKITFKASYLDKLTEGKHPFEAVFSNGSVTGTLEIKSTAVKASTGGIPSTGGLLLIVQIWSVLLLSVGYALVFFSKGFMRRPVLAGGAECEEAFVDAIVDDGFDDDLDF